MGQKTSPLSLRDNFNFIVWGSTKNLANDILLRKNIKYFFQQKGMLINNLAIKTNGTILYIDLNFIISRSSFIYSRRFRRFLKTKKERKKKNISILKFLKKISFLYGTTKIYFRARRLDKKINKELTQIIILKGNKIGLFRYIKKPNIKDLLIASSLLAEGYPIEPTLINNIIAGHFTWLPKRQHKHYLSFLRNFFNIVFSTDQLFYKNILGIKLLVKGRINGRTQAEVFRGIVGSISAQTINKNVLFDQKNSFTRLGSFGWKLWITKNK